MQRRRERKREREREEREAEVGGTQTWCAWKLDLEAESGLKPKHSGTGSRHPK